MRSILSPTHTSPAARSPAPAARGNVRVRTAADKMSGIVFEPFNEVRMRRGEGKEQRPPGHTSKKREKKKNAPPLHLPTPSHTGQARAGRRVQGRRDHRLPGAVRLHGRVRGGPQRADQVSGEARRAVGWGWVGEHTAPMRSPPPLDAHFPHTTHTPHPSQHRVQHLLRLPRDGHLLRPVSDIGRDDEREGGRERAITRE